MTPEEKNNLRHLILKQLERADPNSVILMVLSSGLKIAGLSLSDQTVQQQLAYLIDKKLVAESREPLAQGVKRYRITAAGVDYLEREDLI